jgi:hypothetical protein
VYKGRKIYFRGRRTIDAVFKDITKRLHFDEAVNVLISGDSAGGLATVLNADYIKDNIFLTQSLNTELRLYLVSFWIMKILHRLIQSMFIEKK